MQKIKTIFDRNWEGNKGVIDKYIINNLPELLASAIATEKLDGSNVRLTVRSHKMVRLEKRRNPTKIEKHKGIEEPWYIDANEYDPADKHLYQAANNTNLANINDGEWSAEAVGGKIQGNPLNIPNYTCCLFSCGHAPILDDCPLTYEELKKYLSTKQSKFGTGLIEGVVWHCKDGSMFKIKGKDFK